MRILILLAIIFISFPTLAQTKTVAIPVRLQKSNLSIAEQLELQSYGEVAMTPLEINKRQAEMLEWDSQADNRKWKKDMNDLEQQLPDLFEEIIDVLTPQQRASLSVETISIYNQKKTTRSQKP